MESTNEEQRFIDQIMADRDAKDVPLVYADWLDEHGQGERARLIRNEVYGRPDDLSDDEWWEMRMRNEEFVDHFTTATFGAALRQKFAFEWRRGLVRADVKRVARPTAADVRQLARFPYLTELYRIADLTPAALAALAECPNVKRLTPYCSGSQQLKPKQWEALGTLAHVERLSLSCAEGPMRGLAHVASMRGLQELDLERTSAGDADVGPLAALTGLEVLDLSDTKVTDDGLSFLRSLVNLRELNLHYLDVTDAIFDRLTSLPRLTSLDVGSTKIRDPIACILRLPRLQKVGLRRFAQITDADLPDLMRMPDLVEVDLRLTHVTRFRLAPLIGQTKWKKVRMELKTADSYDAEQREIDAFEAFCKQHGVDADVDWE